MSAPEAWLRGPVDGVAPLLQPVAHSFVQLREELPRVVAGLDAATCWRPVAGGWSVGEHLRHLAGSTDRLVTYARGAGLDEAQLQRLKAEKAIPDPVPAMDDLVRDVDDTLAQAIADVRAWPDAGHDLVAPRAVGRAGMPSTVIGLLFHAAEHAQRHMAQAAVTRRVALGANA